MEFDGLLVSTPGSFEPDWPRKWADETLDGEERLCRGYCSVAVGPAIGENRPERSWSSVGRGGRWRGQWDAAVRVFDVGACMCPEVGNLP